MKLHGIQVMRPEQGQVLLPRLLQGVEILQVPVQDLAARLEALAGINEALRVEDPEPTGEAPAAALPAGADPMEYERPGGLLGRAEPLPAAVESAPAPGPTLAEELHLQAGVLDLAPPVRRAFALLVDTLDRNGHLKVPLARLAGPEGPSVAALEQAYTVLRTLDPRGVGAPDAVECLLSQLDPEESDLSPLTALLTLHLEDLARGRHEAIRRSLGVDGERLEGLIRKVRALNPYPGRAYAETPARPVHPDVTVERENDGCWRVEVEERGLPRASIAPDFRRRLDDPELPEGLRRELEARLRSAKWVIEAIGQRRQTLYRVARELVERQEAYFREGPAALKPLTMEEVARTLGVHLSTVSRTVADKWVACPQGVVPLRSLFDHAVSAAGSSRTSVRERVRALVEGEDPRQPLSDEELVEKLALEGVRVARRTVAKYRGEAGIPSSWRRRRP